MRQFSVTADSRVCSLMALVQKILAARFYSGSAGVFEAINSVKRLSLRNSANSESL